jgi:putative salt-induced outer membrane protein YdiY
MRKPAKFLMVALLFCIVGNARADEIVFKNGERLIGTVVRMETGKVVFASQLAGEVEVDLEQVESLSTESLMSLHIDDGTILKSSGITADENGFIIKGAGVFEGQALTLSAIKAINPRVVPEVTWKGNITAGYTITNGNTYNEQGNFSLNVVRRSKKTRLRHDSIYVVGRDEDDDTGDKVTSEENFTIKTKYDYFFTQKLFGYLSGSFKKDHIADLDYRIIPGTGLGYQWIEADWMKFSTDAGVALLKEKYTSKVPGDEDDDGDGISDLIDEVTRSNDMSLQFGYNFDWLPHPKANFLSNLTYTPAVDDFSDYFLTFDAELRLAITGSFYSSFKFILDYDSEPGGSSDTTDTKYIFGLGWNFF